ncbi:hypothetical protein T439DRAFT_345509 [Meredithblackwellia eburnea MCA 4105]
MREVNETKLGWSPITPKGSGQLNGASFIQDALVTFKGWQYAAYYQDARVGVRHVCLARRQLAVGAWESFAFEDYKQTLNDGHNTISIGVCEGDGSLHLAFDLHNSDLRYRKSLTGVLFQPELHPWSSSLFGPILNALPGDSEGDFQITYPRFLSLSQPAGALLFTYRVGMSGLGNDILFLYRKNSQGEYSWNRRGVFLRGISNNAYINGIDADSAGTLHLTWCYRDYVPVSLAESRQQAGPNGPENNHDLCYAWSPPEEDGSGPGLRWFTPAGLVGTSESSPIVPTSKGIIGFGIPKYSGILNQEAQCVGVDGRVHALNREFVDRVEHWFHYELDSSAATAPRKTCLPVLPPSTTSARGKVIGLGSESLLFLLPQKENLIFLKRTKDSWEVLLQLKDAGGETGMEPLFDRRRLSNTEDGLLSVFVGVLDASSGRREIKVLDFTLERWGTPPRRF